MKTFHIQTLGCKVNHYESDQMATLLRSRGLMPADAGSADLRVINTCSVTMQAASQSRQSVRRMVRLPVLAGPTRACESAGSTQPADLAQTLAANPTGTRPRVLVTGCWATSHPADASALPGVDAVIGHHHNVALELDRLLARWKTEGLQPSAQPGESVGFESNRQVETSTPAGRRNGDIETKGYETVNEKEGLEEAEGTKGRSDRGTKRVIAFDAGSEVRIAGSAAGGTRPSGVPRNRLEDVKQAIASTGTTSLPLLGLRQANRQRAFLKIQDGCDAHCTYCIIPSLRPTLWSKPIDDVVTEARALVEAGHVEIVLTGIFLGAYGQPTALRRRQPVSTAKPLGELLDSLCARVPGLRRLRLSSLEPGDLTDELIAVLRAHPAVVPHFHLPLQSGSDHLLRRMNRQYTREDFLKMVERVSRAFDRPALTTDIVVGFPGETDEEFERSMEVSRASGFIHIHAFPYSPRPGTAAARWAKQFVRGPVVNERIERLRAIAEEQSYGYRKSFIGQTVEVIIERDTETSIAQNPQLRHGRCERYFSVTVNDPSLQPGQTALARISQVTREATVGQHV